MAQKTPIAAPVNISPEAQASLDRLLSSELISRAPRLRVVLKFLIDALIDGTADTLNEQTIGQAVFGRPQGYNPGEDNIVRVTIRHLRARIEEFYHSEGHDEEYVFSIPKGKYIPALLFRQPEKPSGIPVLEQPAVAERSEQPPSVSAFAVVASSRGFVAALPWILMFLLAAAICLQVFRAHAPAVGSSAQQQHGLLSLLLTNDKQTTLVVTDANLQAYRMIFRKTVSLSAYIDGSYEQPVSSTHRGSVADGAWQYVASSPHSDLTSSVIATEMEAAAAPLTIRIKYPRDLSIRDFQHDNYILLGEPWIDPWGQLYEDRLNFRVLPLKDDPARAEIHNTNRLPSEPADFIPHQQDNLSVNYVRVALLRNFSNDGYIVLLGATSEEALEAGGRFLINQEQLQDLTRHFNVASPAQLPSLEIVLEVECLRSLPEHLRILAERKIGPQ